MGKGYSVLCILPPTSFEQEGAFEKPVCWFGCYALLMADKPADWWTVTAGDDKLDGVDDKTGDDNDADMVGERSSINFAEGCMLARADLDAHGLSIGDKGLCMI